jgi:hypothetical protein
MAFQAKDYVLNGYSRGKLREFIDSAHRNIGDKNDLISEVLQGLGCNSQLIREYAILSCSEDG